MREGLQSSLTAALLLGLHTLGGGAVWIGRGPEEGPGWAGSTGKTLGAAVTLFPHWLPHGTCAGVGEVWEREPSTLAMS